MCPGWSFQSPLLETIYDTSLDNYIQWINAKVFLSNRNPPQLICIKQCLILPYRNTIQEAQTFVKMADICCYGVRYSKCESPHRLHHIGIHAVLLDQGCSTSSLRAECGPSIYLCDPQRHKDKIIFYSIYMN